MATNQLPKKYPQEIKLDNGQSAELALMNADDRDAVIAFARSLPEEDLLFLRVDLTQPGVVDDWIANLSTGRTVSLVARHEGELAGYATVHRDAAPWTRRVGEIRVNVAPGYRGQNLGRNLISHIFDIARSLGLKKLSAQMTPDQRGAQAAFRRLGFMPEALLADYVEDRSGASRDLLIMTYDIEGLTDMADEPLAV